MARKSERVIELEEGILNAVEAIDTGDQSRVGLLETLDNIRLTLEVAYGEDFEDDLAEKMGIELIDEDEDEDSDSDEETYLI